jgi:hypothetical protein
VGSQLRFSRFLVFLLAVILGVAIFFGGALSAIWLPSGPPASATATALPSATAVPTGVPTATATTSAAPVPPPAATPTPVPPSEDEARGVVRDFFAALAAKDYPRLHNLTAGQGQATADQVAAQAQQSERDNGVTLQPRVSRLDFLGSEPRGTGLAERVAYTIDIEAHMGPLTVPADSQSGEAVFVVERVGDRLLITEIQGQLT